MASITIRNLDDDAKRRLRLQAARHNCSMEEEARTILRKALDTDASESNLADLALSLFGQENGLDLAEHETVSVRNIDLGLLF